VTPLDCALAAYDAILRGVGERAPEIGPRPVASQWPHLGSAIRDRPIAPRRTLGEQVEILSALGVVANRLDPRSSAIGPRWPSPCALAGLPRATIIHGHGTGALRDAVRAATATHPLVGTARPGERGEGGDGATIVTF
jgi:hypothetical protein